MLGKKLKIEEETVAKQQVPDVFKGMLGPITNPAGWTKSLEGLPSFTINEINNFFKNSGKSVLKNATVVKKSFKRGEQLIEENFVDLFNIYCYNDDELFSVKALCAASLRKTNRWVSVSIRKDTSSVEFAHCQCEAGQGGLCSHSYAIMKLLVKYNTDCLKEIPEPKACTSQLCYWNVPQGRNRINRKGAMNYSFSSPAVRKDSSCSLTGEKGKRAVSCTLYEARTTLKRAVDKAKLKEFTEDIKKQKPEAPASFLFSNHSTLGEVPTLYGKMPLGSPLSFQLSYLPHGFTVYCTRNLHAFATASQDKKFPDFPLAVIENVTSEFVSKLISQSQIDLIESLRVCKDEVNFIEQRTVGQYTCSEWESLRRNRFTASMCIQLKEKKTERGFPTLAKLFSSPNKGKDVTNTIVHEKLEHGKYYEEEARQLYLSFHRSKGYYINIQSSGFVIDHVNFVLGASPDGKIIDPNVKDSFGLLEIKCPAEYKDCDPRDACLIAKKFCLKAEVSNQIRMDRDHGYFDQVQFQMGVTGARWCDFVVYTFKGMAIDRIYFDNNHWKALSSRVAKFYFDFLLPALCTVEDQTS